MVANRWFQEEERVTALMGMFIVDRQYQQLIDFVESRWSDLDAFEVEEPQRTGFGSGDLLDIAYAYQQIDRADKFTEVMARVRESHEQQRMNGANNVAFWLNCSYQSLLEEDEEKAITQMELARDLGFYAWGRGTDRNPAFTVLNGNPRYEQMLTEMLAHVNSERAKLDLEHLKPEPYL